MAEDIFGEAYKIERAFPSKKKLVKGTRKLVFWLLRNAYSDGFEYSGAEGLSGYDLVEYLRQPEGSDFLWWDDYSKLESQDIFRALEYLVKEGKVGKFRDGSYYPLVFEY